MGTTTNNSATMMNAHNSITLTKYDVQTVLNLIGINDISCPYCLCLIKLVCVKFTQYLLRMKRGSFYPYLPFRYTIYMFLLLYTYNHCDCSVNWPYTLTCKVQFVIFHNVSLKTTVRKCQRFNCLKGFKDKYFCTKHHFTCLSMSQIMQFQVGKKAFE